MGVESSHEPNCGGFWPLLISREDLFNAPIPNSFFPLAFAKSLQRFPEIQGFNFPIGTALCQWISTQNASIILKKSLTGGYMTILLLEMGLSSLKWPGLVAWGWLYQHKILALSSPCFFPKCPFGGPSPVLDVLSIPRSQYTAQPCQKNPARWPIQPQHFFVPLPEIRRRPAKSRTLLRQMALM